MHQLWQHKNGIWYVLHGPRLRQRASLRTNNRSQAEIRLAQFIASAGSLGPDDPTVGQILAGYRDDHGKTLRGKDGLKYGVAALDKRLGVLQPAHLTPAAIKKYAKERGASAGTILREIGILRAALGWAADNKWISSRPSIPDPVKRPPSRQRWMTRDEAKRLLAACHAPHLRLFVMLGLMTCARSSAILELPWAQVDLNRRVIDYGQGHGNKRRVIVPINDQLATALQAARTLACTDRVIEAHGKPLASIKKGFAAACDRAGIEGVTPHILRHTGATWMVEDGIPEEEVARMLGDTPEMVRKVYGHHSPNFLKRASSALQMEVAAQ